MFPTENAKPVDTPVEKGHNLKFDLCPKTDKERKEMV